MYKVYLCKLTPSPLPLRFVCVFVSLISSQCAQKEGISSSQPCSVCRRTNGMNEKQVHKYFYFLHHPMYAKEYGFTLNPNIAKLSASLSLPYTIATRRKQNYIHTQTHLDSGVAERNEVCVGFVCWKIVIWQILLRISGDKNRKISQRQTSPVQNSRKTFGKL